VAVYGTLRHGRARLLPGADELRFDLVDPGSPEPSGRKRALFLSRQASVAQWNASDPCKFAWPLARQGVVSKFSPARQFVVRFAKEQPGPLLLTSSKLGWFVWESTLDRSRIYELSCRHSLKANYVSGPIRIILTYDFSRFVTRPAAKHLILSAERQTRDERLESSK
jgi:hypothetical protein